jgi:23S rRNA (cytidine1920-2'-O)/16S rRNA (cytidine1409-2'-O)-methyltransferase
MTEYVSRAALKLASVAEDLEIDFSGQVVLDIGSSTGGFTQYALEHGARQVVAVEVGTNQLHPSLRPDPRIVLFEKTDIRDLKPEQLQNKPTMVVADVSFISLRQILPHALTLTAPSAQFVVMVKPQFEANAQDKHKGIIKNEHVRRDILKDFEFWAKQYFVIKQKADSAVAGTHGNRERFYLLQKLS